MKWTIALWVLSSIYPVNSIGQNEVTYLFSYFLGNGEDGLHLATSQDGYSFKTLKSGKSFLKPTVGKDKLMRDPSITRAPDGTFHMVWTTGWRDRIIGYASSTDLIHWSSQKSIPVMQHEPTAKNSWAPEIFFDSIRGRYIIIWSTTIPGRFSETDISSDNGLNHRMYYTTTTNFQSFTETKLFYDGGFNVIDGFIAQDGGRYVLFLKDETKLPKAEKNLRVAYSDNALGPYGPASEPFTKSWVEGPSAVEIGDEWIVYYDEYRDKRYGAMKSGNLNEWENISNRISFPKGARHGTVFAVNGFKLNNSLPEGFEWEKPVNSKVNGMKFSIFQQPITLHQTKSRLTIYINHSENFNLSLTSASGQTVLAKKGKKQQIFTINKDELPTGIYFFTHCTGKRMASRQTVVTQ